ncbi:hypothetical protein NDA10_000430 [Ustilago hordei]|nr:hypothetical protein NDA10_000430 [Ustilago hordei]
MASAQQIKTPLTEQFGIKHPIMLAGMNVAAGPELVAAVTNAGGIGVIVGGGARKTNTDYTNGQLPELIDIIESGAKLFVSAVGVPPAQVVSKLHAAKIIVAGIIGHPKHAPKVLEAGVDMVIFQGGEGGGHTGGIFNGRGLAASICYGADGIWVGTRFVASKESGAPKAHKEAVLKSTHETDIRTIIFTGRPLRLYKTKYIDDGISPRRSRS